MKLNFTTIVVPVDLSDRSLRAVPYAAGLAERFGAHVHIVYVSQPTAEVSDVAWGNVDYKKIDDSHDNDALHTLERIASEQLPGGVKSVTHVLHGDPVHGIIDYASDQDADLIVMATHGRTGLGHVLMGSVAESVVRRAPCAVLTLKQPMPT